MHEEKKVTPYAIFIWFLAILFFFYEFFLRIFLGTVGSGIREDLHLTIKQFSFVGAAYYLTYGLMQVPVGFLTEKIGTKVILSSAALICTIGVYWLALADSFWPALFSRVLIGFGSSFAFVSLLIISLNWFPKKYFGFLCGFSLFLGAVGPLLAGAPLAYVYRLMDGNWRRILEFIGVSGIALTVLLAIFMRSSPKQKKQEIIFITPQESTRKKLLELIKNAQAWLIFFSSGCIYCPLPILAAYFGTAYLQTRGYDTTDAAFLISVIWIGYAIGSPLLGKISDRIKRRKPFLYLFSFIGCLTSAYILYFSPNQYLFLIALFFVLGFASSAQALAFALIVEHTPKKLHSVAIGFNNAGVMLFGAIFPSIAGFIIHASLKASGKITLTSVQYEDGLTIIPILYAVAGCLILFFVKETFCREQHEVHKLAPLHKASDLL